MLFEKELAIAEVNDVPIRLLAHLGDAVFELYEREREVMSTPTAKKMHKKVVRRVNSVSQSNILENLMSSLNEKELDIVRRARNLTAGSRKGDQTAYRRATAFEALIGYVYLTDKKRLQELLDLTLEEASPDPESV